MSKIFCILGKSSSGKDTIYKELLSSNLELKRIVPYTTRPIREGEQNGEEYYFVDEKKLLELKENEQVIECRSYQTYHGIWNYFTVSDDQIELEKNNYLVIGTLESYLSIRKYFGKEVVIPIYIEIEDGERLQRALEREKKQKEPKYEEMCRRFLADQQDFSKEKLLEAGIEKKYQNNILQECIESIKIDILKLKEKY